jgi:hypothetical protein
MACDRYTEEKCRVFPKMKPLKEYCFDNYLECPRYKYSQERKVAKES